MARDSWLKRLIWLRVSPGSGASYEKTVGPASIISISDAKPKPAKSLIVGMEPIQDLHGYDSPWPAGGGKNLFDPSNMTATGITVTGNTVVGKGSAFHNAFVGNGIPNLTFAEDTQYTLSMVASTDASASASGNGLLFRLTYTDSTTSVLWLQNTSTSPTPYQITSDAGKTIANIKMSYGGTSGENTWTLTNIQLEVGSSVSDFAPYSNICPITGRTGVNVYHSGEDTSNPTIYPVSWQSEAGTVYGGTVDLVSGLMTVTDAEIASYNGETLPSTWISDRDVYAEGTTPTIGAQVVYELATPQTYQLTPTQIQLLKGSNTLWSDGDSLTLTYLGTTPANLLGGMLGGGFGGGYNPPVEQDPEELTEPEATETDEPAEETPAEEGENNGE